MEKLRNLNQICKEKSKGILKKWIYKNKNDFDYINDFLEKMKYSIDNINYEIPKFNKKEVQDMDIIYLIVLVDWIKSSYNEIEKLIKNEIITKFKYENEKKLKTVKKYFTAIRSFIVAHPLTTNKHPEYGLDGNFICSDIRISKGIFDLDFIPQHRFSINELKRISKVNADFYLKVYSKDFTNMRMFQWVGCNYDDILQVAFLYIDKLYALDNFLIQQKRKDY